MSDWTLVGAVGAGLVYSPLLILIFVALALRVGATSDPIRLTWSHLFQVISIAWAGIVIAQRGLGNGSSEILLYAFLWVMPFYLALYRPTSETVKRFGVLIGALFIMDFAVNLLSAMAGNDIFGRIVDDRTGVAGGRFGGVFGHAFYSGSISVLAFASALASPRLRWCVPFVVTNLLLSGSWRFIAAIVLIPVLMLLCRSGSRRREALLVIAFTATLVTGVVLTSSFAEGAWDFDANPANDFRVFAWLLAITKTLESPWFGVGYPGDRPAEGISFEAIDEYLIAESWYLGSMITFGVPYTVFRLLGYLSAFYSKPAHRRWPAEVALIPFVLIDLAYGRFFEAVLVYTWIWLLVTTAPPSSGWHRSTPTLQPATPNPARLPLPPRPSGA